MCRGCEGISTARIGRDLSVLVNELGKWLRCGQIEFAKRSTQGQRGAKRQWSCELTGRQRPQTGRRKDRRGQREEPGEIDPPRREAR